MKTILPALQANQLGKHQIAGSTCKICERQIVLATEGKFCAHCSSFVHHACLHQDKCDICGQAFQSHEYSVRDPLRDAIIPYALRPGNSRISVAVILLAGVVGLMIFVLLYSLTYGLSHAKGL